MASFEINIEFFMDILSFDKREKINNFLEKFIKELFEITNEYIFMDVSLQHNEYHHLEINDNGAITKDETE